VNRLQRGRGENNLNGHGARVFGNFGRGSQIHLHHTDTNRLFDFVEKRNVLAP
jgi:hypothetical protein